MLMFKPRNQAGFHNYHTLLPQSRSPMTSCNTSQPSLADRDARRGSRAEITTFASQGLQGFLDSPNDPSGADITSWFQPNASSNLISAISTETSSIHDQASINFDGACASYGPGTNLAQVGINYDEANPMWRSLNHLNAHYGYLTVSKNKSPSPDFFPSIGEPTWFTSPVSWPQPMLVSLQTPMPLPILQSKDFEAGSSPPMTAVLISHNADPDEYGFPAKPGFSPKYS
jgi:hypothetical protein